MAAKDSAAHWLAELSDYHARLIDRLNFLGMSLQQLNGVVPPAVVLAVEELTTAGEELRTSQEELRSQAAELADAQSAVEAARRHYQELFDLCPDAYLVMDKPYNR